MARYESKQMTRIGDTFTTERGGIAYDLSDLKMLASGVDTIKQIYKCTIKPDVLLKLNNHFENSTSKFITFGDHEWIYTKSGAKSGYQYNLKNLDLGFVVLLKSFYAEAEDRASHLKIEVSPQIIDQYGLVCVTHKLREVASIFADTLEAKSVACHIYCDVKGLQIPDNFEHNLVTRSKRNLSVSGIGSAHFDMDEVQYTHNRGETYMFGKANQLQFCLYNKTLEALKNDKLAFHESIWKRTPSSDLNRFPDPEYNDGSQDGVPDTVHRLEFRFHHTVIEQFVHGNYNATENEINIREPKDLVKHLDAFWQYSLNNFRLHHSTTYIHPIWQMLIDDVQFSHVQHKHFIYKRASKKSESPSSRRNVAMFMGNHLKLAARKRFKPSDVVDAYLMLGLESELCDYFGLKQFGESDLLHQCLTDFVTKRMNEHWLNGVAA